MAVGGDVRGDIAVFGFVGAYFDRPLGLFGGVMATSMVVRLKIFLWLGKFIV